MRRLSMTRNVDMTAVPIWSEQPHYKHHSIRLKVRGEGNLSLAVEKGKNECRYDDKRPENGQKVLFK